MVLSQVLASEVTIGFEDIVNTQVLRVNGVPIDRLRSLVQAVDAALAATATNSAHAYLSFDLEYGQKIILDARQAAGATAECLATHSIPADRSADFGA